MTTLPTAPEDASATPGADQAHLGRLPSREARIWRHLRAISPSVGYSAVSGVAGLVSGIVLARQLGPGLRGEMAAVIAWVAILTLCGDLGIGFGASYFVSRQRERVHLLWTQSLCAAAVLGSALAIGATTVLPSRIHIASVDRSVAMIAFGAIPIMMATSHQVYLLLGLGYLKEVNRTRFFGAVIYTTIILLLTKLGFCNPSAYLCGFSMAQCMSCGLATYYCRRRLNVRPRLSMAGLPELIKYGLKTQIGSLSAQANLRLDQLLLSLWLAPADLGLYVVAVALSSMPAPLFSALSLVITNSVLRARNFKEGARAACRQLAFAALATSPFLLAAIVAAGWLLRVMFGHQFAGAGSMARLLLAAALFQGVNQLGGAALRSIGWPGRAAWSEFVGVAVTVALLTALVPRVGALGAAIASLAAYSVVSLGQLYWLRVAARKPDDS
jgi:O-antigen/teichoic acid export membrane protein